MKKLLFVSLISILLLSMLTLSLHGFASEAGAIFLTIYPGARPNGMGAAFVGLADDALATYYNQGGMAFIENTNFYLMHSNWLPGLYPDMYYDVASVVKPIPGWGTVGGNIIYLTTGETEARDEQGVPVGKFRTFDVSFSLGYATKMIDNLGLGVGVKFIYSFLAPPDIVEKVLHMRGGTGMSWALDIGTLYKTPLPGLSAGASLQNIGPSIQYAQSGNKDPLPRTLRMGVSYKLFNTKMNKLIFLADITKIIVNWSGDFAKENEDTWKSIGMEYTYFELLTGRIGYFKDSAGRRIGLTYGGGVQFQNLKFDIGVDDELYEFPTANYRFSLSYAF
ncbi:MAG: PorV/PorQ family protein [Candidatus Cloacimonadota bacterium]|nr:MAG: PorV/PorQ family protein [Candidatus Cloacimonadota bacterium]